VLSSFGNFLGHTYGAHLPIVFIQRAYDVGSHMSRDVPNLGFHRWTEAEVSQFEARHPIGTRPRLALALGLHTGQARQDVVAMGPQHAPNEIFYWIRGKTAEITGTELAIPLHPTLRAIIDATPSEHLTFLVTEFGKPFTAAGFGNWFCDGNP
jgi:hypothetical protein